MLLVAARLGLDGEFRYLTGRSRGRLDTRFLPATIAPEANGVSYPHPPHGLTDRLRITANLVERATAIFRGFGLGPDGTSVTFLDVT